MQPMEGDAIRALSRSDKLVSSVGRHSSSCGYCHSDGNTSVTCGMYAHRLTVDIYQELLDSGWRRSGCWLYRPIPDATCCNPYTIRLDVHKFKPDKKQKQVLRKMAAYLEGEPLRKHPQEEQQEAGPAPSSKPAGAFSRTASVPPARMSYAQALNARSMDMPSDAAAVPRSQRVPGPQGTVLADRTQSCPSPGLPGPSEPHAAHQQLGAPEREPEASLRLSGSAVATMMASYPHLRRCTSLRFRVPGDHPPQGPAAQAAASGRRSAKSATGPRLDPAQGLPHLQSPPW
eukprot:jgi/Botrbrau1/3968/Bobra.0365s0041.1